METNISVERALELIRGAAGPVGTETIPATLARGRVLAEDVAASIDQPPWPRAPLDGYALRGEDSAGASQETPVTLRVVDTVYAGGWCDREIGPGESVRIMTGAPIPAGCNSVIMQEHTDCGEREVRLYAAVEPWSNYCYAGEDFRRGDILLHAGTRLTGNAAGALASSGLVREDVMLTVYKKVRCAVICTGDELVPNSVHPLPKGKIYSSNEAVIASRLEALGMEVTAIRGEFGDDADALAAILRETAGNVDVIFTTGGVSEGVKDILHDALAIAGAERVFWRVKLKPGSPMAFSLLGKTPVMSLSGNPFAASATFELFGRPLLQRLAGADDLEMPVFTAVLDEGFPKRGVRRFLRGTVKNGHVTLPQGHSSGQLASAAAANCLVEIPQSKELLAPGCAVSVHLI